MAEDVNVKIIKKIRNSKYRENVKKFLLELIREEFANEELDRWNYSDCYDKNIEDHSRGE